MSAALGTRQSLKLTHVLLLAEQKYTLWPQTVLELLICKIYFKMDLKMKYIYFKYLGLTCTHVLHAGKKHTLGLKLF